MNLNPNMAEEQRGIKGAARRREMVIILILLAAVGFLFFFQSHVSTWKVEAPFPNNLLVVSLIGLNILLLLLLVFLILRNVVKLIFEWKKKVLGAKLKNKLVVAFIGLSLVPTILLFFIAIQFITSSIDSWFTVQVEGSLQESLVVAQVYYQDQASHALHFARQISGMVTQQRLLDQGNQGPLAGLLKSKREEYNLGAVEIISPQLATQLLFRGPTLSSVSFPPL
ncbi:MAG TPA: PAS domain-containing sensor histidine kinase, partial [Thermodesulfobacteriota bacterium]|nr:PAS domain-containing sensor histidine kinase [Thermodesulfobacteriota bacterium]